MTKQDKLWKSLERLTRQAIVCMHEETTHYAFKVAFDGPRKAGEWHTIDRYYLHDFAGIKY